MYEFAYHRPESLAQAASLRRGAADGAYLAGGMTLIPALKQRLARRATWWTSRGLHGPRRRHGSRAARSPSAP